MASVYTFLHGKDSNKIDEIMLFISQDNRARDWIRLICIPL